MGGRTDRRTHGRTQDGLAPVPPPLVPPSSVCRSFIVSLFDSFSIFFMRFPVRLESLAPSLRKLNVSKRAAALVR